MGTRGCDGFIRPDSHPERRRTRPTGASAPIALSRKSSGTFASEWELSIAVHQPQARSSISYAPGEYPRGFPSSSLTVRSGDGFLKRKFRRASCW
ncbi:hypothetical protein KCP69_22005 [Salmonella enterica subsp. enterica]|nr:hypothetical protein KCP69_22005 [Salmonella enterica subsp. enterica]